MKNEVNAKITEEVILQLKSGDHNAFDMVFMAYFSKIKHFINGIIKDDEQSEELAQDIFVKIWSGKDKIDPKKSFNSYMYTSARNAALNYLKHKLIQNSYLKAITQDQLQADSSEEIIYAKETQLLINMTVAAMPEQRKKIYDLSRNKGVSNDEIASVLNISKKTVENQLSLALKDIRNVISMFIIFFL